MYLNLIITAILTAWLFTSFRFWDKYRVNQYQTVAINYIVSLVLGILFNINLFGDIVDWFSEPWFTLAFITGLCFLPTFLVMAYAVKNISLGLTTVSNKISLIIPVLCTFLFISQKEESPLKIIGALIGIIAIVLCAYPNNGVSKTQNTKNNFIIPIVIFIGGGLIDLLILINNTYYLPSNYGSHLSVVTFSAAAISATLLLIYRYIKFNEKIEIKNILAGVTIGIPNYFSIYFLVKSLNDFNNNGAMVFPLLNIGIILINISIGLLIYHEKISRLQIIGVIIALISLVLLLN